MKSTSKDTGCLKIKIESIEESKKEAEDLDFLEALDKIDLNADDEPKDSLLTSLMDAGAGGFNYIQSLIYGDLEIPELDNKS